MANPGVIRGEAGRWTGSSRMPPAGIDNDRWGAAEILARAGAELYIYVCIIPRNHRARAGLPVLATSRAGTNDYGSPSANSEIAFRCRQISKKIANFFATPTPTLPCARMYIIHFARAVMHQRLLLRSLRAPEEKFPERATETPRATNFMFSMKRVARW